MHSENGFNGLCVKAKKSDVNHTLFFLHRMTSLGPSLVFFFLFLLVFVIGFGKKKKFVCVCVWLTSFAVNLLEFVRSFGTSVFFLPFCLLFLPFFFLFV